MMILAFLFPPLAVLLCGKPFQAIINLFLTLLYFPGMIHAVMVVSSHNADRRHLPDNEGLSNFRAFICESCVLFLSGIACDFHR